MTEQSTVSSDIDNAHTVEVLLSSLQAADADGAGAVLDDNLVYQNVGTFYSPNVLLSAL